MSKRIFKIDADKKRTVKTSVAGQVIAALKRADKPLMLNVLASRVKSTKAGKAVSVKDVKARVLKVADWYVKNSDWMTKDDDGYALTQVEG